MAESFESVLSDYRNNDQAIEWAKRVWKLYLEPFLGHMRTANFGTDQIAKYISARKSEEEPAAMGQSTAT